jgi:hypothetical protein
MLVNLTPLGLSLILYPQRETIHSRPNSELITQINWGKHSLSNFNWRIFPLLIKLLVALLKLFNRSYIHSASIGWCCLALKRNTDGDTWQTFLQLNQLTRLGWPKPYSHCAQKLLNPMHWHKLVYFSLPHIHTPPCQQFLWTPHSIVLLHRGLHISDTDGNIGGWRKYTKEKSVSNRAIIKIWFMLKINNFKVIDLAVCLSLLKTMSWINAL